MAKRFLLGLIAAYQRHLSARLPAGMCRYEPTCSRYGHQVITRFGARRGGYLAALRILRCSPWGHGGADPAPETWPGWRPRLR